MKPIAVTQGSPGRHDFFWLGTNYSMHTSSPKRGLGFNLNFGGIFTSPPVAAAAMARRPGVVSADLSPDSSPPQGTTSGTGTHLEDPDLAVATDEVLSDDSGTTGDTFDVTGLRTHRLDLFGLGTNYAMFHKRFWGEQDADAIGPWRDLGGTFVSAPAAIARGERIDVFGLGTDHALFTRSCAGEIWSDNWQRLGGAFTSAPALLNRAPGTLDVFIRGADFTLRTNQLNGTSWFGWQNLGGDLASPPAVVSWGPERIDVFATFKDGTLRHRWWDGQIWNEWENLGGRYTGEPAAVSWGIGRMDVFVVDSTTRGLYHHVFNANTWSPAVLVALGTNSPVAESPAAISTAPGKLRLFVPTLDGHIRIATYDAGWHASASGAQLRIPGQYRISVDYVEAVTARSLNNDTDAAVATVSTGNNLPQIRTQWIGELGLTAVDTAQTNLLDFEPVTVDLAEPFSFSYLVVNNGHAPQDKILAALATAADSLALSGSQSMQEQIGQNIAKFVTVKLLAATAISVPVAGPILAAAEKWLLGKLTEAIFESCDGIVAAEMRAMLGADLFQLTQNGVQPVRVKTRHQGTDSPTICGAKSVYDVTWSIKPL